MSRSTGKVALVTAAGRGTGRATASAFGLEGARVVAADIDEAGGQSVFAGLMGADYDAIFVRADASHGDDVDELVRHAAETYGTLDVAANVAGGIIGPSNPELHELIDEEWYATVALTLRSCFLCMRSELAHGRPRRWRDRQRRLDRGTRPAPTTPPYAAAKAAAAT